MSDYLKEWTPGAFADKAKADQEFLNKKVELSGTLKIVNPADYKFAAENYKVTLWDRIKNWFWSHWPIKPVIM